MKQRQNLFCILLILSILFLAGCGKRDRDYEKNTALELLPLSVTQSRTAEDDPDLSDYPAFGSIAEADFVLPALAEQYIPQGICVLPSEGLIAVSYYGENGLSSILCLLDPADGTLVKSVRLAYEYASKYYGHAGGIGATGKNVYITDDSKCYRIPIADLMAAGDGETVKFADYFTTSVRASFLNINQGILWVGEFYNKEYKTEKTHHHKLSDGTKNSAWLVGYALDERTENELAEQKFLSKDTPATPDYIISIPDQVQGVTRLDSGEFILSESYGRKNDSNLYIYTNILKTVTTESIEINDTQVPLYHMSDSSRIRTIPAPPMAEGIEFIDGKLYLLFESGAKKYNETGKLPLDRAYKLDHF